MAPPPAHRMTTFEWMLLAVLSLLWGGSFFFTEVALFELPPMTVVAVRVAGAALILHIVLICMGRPVRAAPGTWRDFFIMGLLNNAVPFSLIVWGQTHIASGLAAILNAATPLFALIVAHLWTTDEKLTGARLAGVLTGFAGVAVLVGPSVFGTLGDKTWAQVAILGAALSYAFAGVFGRRFKDVRPSTAAAGQLTASAAVMLPLAAFADAPWTLAMPGPATLWALAGLAALSTALAYVIVFRILGAAGAVNLLLVTLLIPPVAVTLGVLFLNETLDTAQMFGMALIGLGLLCVDGRVFAVFRRRR
ncbi:MAG: DMT family transporter [Rhodospirillales bacterium]